MSHFSITPGFRKILPAIAVAIIAAGCGSSSSSAASSTATPTLHLSHASLVKTGLVNVKGKQERVLMNSKGYTLYYFTKDTPKVSHCTGGCSALWPPLVAQSTRIPEPAGLTGQLTVVKDAHGRQVSYNGHLLYTYRGDTKPGETSGQGFLKEWWVATPNLKAPSTASGGGSGW